MAVANPEKSARMQQAVADVLVGRITPAKAEVKYKLARRSICNAVSRARQAKQELAWHGMHPALLALRCIR